MTLNKQTENQDSVRELVSKGYARIAERAESCCGPSTSCCGSAPGVDQAASRIGYRKDQLDVLPEGANLGLGCGNPTAIDSLRPGEVVVDLGSGAGIDVFLAAKEVGPTGNVIEPCEPAREQSFSKAGRSRTSRRTRSHRSVSQFQPTAPSMCPFA